ncbi:MAG: hypothetical protein U0Q07_15130 [Acidimicrobiales bacterium]
MGHRTAPVVAAVAAAALGLVALVGCSGTTTSGAASTSTAPPVRTATVPATDPSDTTPPVDPARLLEAAGLAPADLPPGFEARGEATTATTAPAPPTTATSCAAFLGATRRLDEVPNRTSPELVATSGGATVAKVQTSASVLPSADEAKDVLAALTGQDPCVRRALASSFTKASPDASFELSPSAPIDVGDGGVRYSGTLTRGDTSAQVVLDFFRIGPVVVQVTALDSAGRLGSLPDVERSMAGRIQASS